MGRNSKWKLGKFKTLKLKVYEEKLARYQQILKAQGRTMQQDYEEYINRVITGKNN